MEYSAGLHLFTRDDTIFALEKVFKSLVMINGVRHRSKTLESITRIRGWSLSLESVTRLESGTPDTFSVN